MRDLLRPYAAYFNRKCSLNGRLWQGRFYSKVLDESHFWAALRYVELDSVRAGIVQNTADYRWSSAPAHCGLLQDPLLSPLPDAAALIGDWSDWLRAGESRPQSDLIRRCTKTGRPCGTESFLKGLEQTTGRFLIPHRVGRPSREDLVDLTERQDPETAQRDLFVLAERLRR